MCHVLMVIENSRVLTGLSTQVNKALIFLARFLKHYDIQLPNPQSCCCLGYDNSSTSDHDTKDGGIVSTIDASETRPSAEVRPTREVLL